MRIRQDEPDVVAMYEAVDLFRERSLRKLLSSFLPDTHPNAAAVWTSSTAHELVEKFINQPDQSKRSFLDKLRDQLADASNEAVQLLVELSWLHLVVSVQLRPQTKRALIDDIASIGHAAGPPEPYLTALDHGIIGTGVSFQTRRPNQLWLLVRFAEAWTGGTFEERTRWLDDPWAFRELVFGLEGVADQTQRHALLHLIHPDTFEDSVSQNHKRRIALLATPAEVGENDDRTIASVRKRLEASLGQGFSFYSDGARPLWNPEPELEDEPDLEQVVTSERNAWLVRGSGGELVPDWLERGVCWIGFGDSFPFDLKPGQTREQLRTEAADVGTDTTAGGFNAELGQVWKFVNSVQIGDYVVTVAGQDIYLGVVASGVQNIGERKRARTEREVEWLNPGQPVARNAVAPELYSKMRTLLTLTDITSVVDELERWVSNETWKVQVGQSKKDVKLAPATAELSDELLLPREWLDTAVSLLAEKRQLIFYGPPGTGKTFLAQAIADHLTKSGGTFELIQFHPSYTYEDFFEGYRPVPSTGGGVAFEIKPGPLRRLAHAAQQERSVPHILIVDEINRANLAKVFGELYFSLEYRDEPITLQYSDDRFVLPDNLFVIGTMNTADRSIALVDAAMRRRFYFMEMAPTEPPIDGLLDRWLTKNKLGDSPARMLEILNERIGDPDAAIGPSYLMSKSIETPGRLERTWQHAIMPLLAERFYGTDLDVETFSYRAIAEAMRDAAD